MTRIPKLSDMQLTLLATACQHDDGSMVPPAESLGDQLVPIRKSVAGLVKRSLAKEIDVADPFRSWRDEDDRHIGVVTTDAGRAIMAAGEKGDDAPGAESQASPAGSAPVKAVSLERELREPEITAARAVRPGTKQALVIDLLCSDAGATIGEPAGATGWLPHTTRAALTGLRKRGFAIVSEKAEGSTRYHVAAGGRS